MSIRYFIIALPLLLLLTTQSTLAAKKAVFHSIETISSDMQAFTKWNNMLLRYKKEKTSHATEPCNNTTKRCYMTKWQKFLNSLKTKSKKQQIQAVHKHINQAQYIIDPINWGIKDYWASPKQFFIKDGDCEDYAITKFMSLRELGIKNSDMRVVVLNDTNLRTLHSVLIVSLNGETLVLDNQIPQVVSANQIHHYKPIYSINETNWWMHRF